MVWTVLDPLPHAYLLTLETPNPYNRAGSLSVWSDDRLIVLDAHMRGGDNTEPIFSTKPHDF